MGGIYHKGEPYSRQMVVDTDLSAVSNNPLKNRAVTGLVDDVIAPVEGANASQAYAQGAELIFNNLLYKANQAIQQGTAFNPESGGNIDLAGTIVDQLKSLFDGETELKMLPSFATDANPPYVSNGLRFYQFPANWANAPSGVSVSGFLIDMRINSTTGFEFAGAWNSDSLYYRRFTSSTWGTWKQIYGQTVKEGTIPTNLSSIANATHTNVCSVQLEAGTYLIECTCRFASNATGIRTLTVSTTSQSSFNEYLVMANSGQVTDARESKLYTLSSAATVYLVAYQNSGGALGVSGISLKAFKLY